jgi:AcrR family transcriptional regulator
MRATSEKAAGSRSAKPSPSTRHGRRRQRTRLRLVDAARRVIGRKGVEATSIIDITEEADLGFGTFYNYFDSKDAILAAATAAATEELGPALDRLNEQLSDPAETLSVSVRHCARMVERDPIWAWFVVRTTLYQEQMAAVHGQRLANDLRRGVEAGRFTETDVRLLNHVIGGAVWAVMRAKLVAALGPDADAELAATVLRMVGLPSGEAREIAWRPLPDIDLPARDQRL